MPRGGHGRDLAGTTTAGPSRHGCSTLTRDPNGTRHQNLTAVSILGMSTTHTDPRTLPVIDEAADFEILRHLDCGRRVRTYERMTLTVNGSRYALGTPVESIIDGTAAADEVTLTSDGRPAWTHAWHEGPDGDAEWVYVERWTEAGRVFHGYIHPDSRRLLQAG